MSFSPATYLRGLGWGGPGTPLTDAPGARSKPVVVAQKKTLAGLGKDRDTSHQWWDDVFKAVADKVGSKGASDASANGGSGTSTPQSTDHDRTSTGIISPRPPRPRASAEDLDSNESASALPTASTPGTGGINKSILAAAQLAAARRELYSRFLRGGARTGVKATVSSSATTSATTTDQEDASDDAAAGSGNSKKKKKRVKTEAQLEAKRIRKTIRDARRARKAEKRALEQGDDVKLSADDIDKKERKRQRRQQKEDDRKEGESVDKDARKRKRREEKKLKRQVTEQQQDLPIAVIEQPLLVESLVTSTAASVVTSPDTVQEEHDILKVSDTQQTKQGKRKRNDKDRDGESSASRKAEKRARMHARNAEA